MTQREMGTAAALNVLGLPPVASATEIVSAYRRLARRTHPDLCPDPDAEARFVTLTAAYRRALDTAGHAAIQAAAESSRFSPTRPQTRHGRKPVQFTAGPVHYRPTPPVPASGKG